MDDWLRGFLTLGRKALNAEWRNCPFARRLYVALNESGEDLRGLVGFLISSAARLKKSGPDLDRAMETEDIYERFISVVRALGEPLACNLIRERHPDPPEFDDEKIPGARVGRTRDRSILSPRNVPNPYHG